MLSSSVEHEFAALVAASVATYVYDVCDVWNLRPLPTAVYDTETCEWHNIASVQRFRHSSWGAHQIVLRMGCHCTSCRACKRAWMDTRIRIDGQLTVGMAGLLFSYGGFDHKNPRGSQRKSLDSKSSRFPVTRCFRCLASACFSLLQLASGPSQQQICRSQKGFVHRMEGFCWTDDR